jgi:hypothetical protein
VVKGEAAYPFTDAEKIGNISVLEAIRRSAATGSPVKTVGGAGESSVEAPLNAREG